MDSTKNLRTERRDEVLKHDEILAASLANTHKPQDVMTATGGEKSTRQLESEASSLPTSKDTLKVHVSHSIELQKPKLTRPELSSMHSTA